MIVAKFTPKSSKLAFGTCTAWPISENDSGKLFTIFLFSAVRHDDEFLVGKKLLRDFSMRSIFSMT